MKRMTTIAILIFAVTQISNAGWLSSIGQRIVNGAVNTVQTNISSKVNRTIDNAMDGKLQQNSKKGNSQAYVSANSGNQVVSGEEYLDTKITTTSKRGNAIPFTGNYTHIDLGITKFTGELIYEKRIETRQRKLEVDEFLSPGYYVIWIDSESIEHDIHVVYEHEVEGIGFGYGIINRKRIFDNGPLNLKGNKEGIMYVVEVLPNTQGHLELTLVNSEQLMGSGTIEIFKIPGPTLK